MDESRGLVEHTAIQDENSASQMKGKTSVHSLPTELIVKIFQELATEAICKTPFWPYSGWITVMRVCRLWRDIATGCPSLWAYITPTAFPALDTVLSRSQDAPLTFILSLLVHSRKSQYSRVSDRELGLLDLHRTKRYELSGTNNTIERFLDYPHSHGAARLQILRLRSHRDMSTYTGGWNIPLPSLTNLSIDYLPGRLVPRLASCNLRHLDLQSIHPRLALRSFLEVLSDLSLLRSLRVFSSVTSDTNDVSPPLSIGVTLVPITLRYLEEVYLEDTGPMISPLLDHLTVPIPTQTRIVAHLPNRVKAEDLLASLRGNLSRRIAATVPAVNNGDICSIKCRERTQNVQLFFSHDDFSLVTPWLRRTCSIFDAHTYFNCDCLGGACDCGLARAMATIPSLFDTSRVRFLSLDLSSANILRSYYGALRQMTRVEQLDIYPAVAAAVILELPQASDDDSKGKPILPALTSVVLSESPNAPAHTIENFRKVLECIAHRRQLPGIAHLGDVHVSTGRYSESLYEEIQGYCGVIVQFHWLAD